MRAARALSKNRKSVMPSVAICAVPGRARWARSLSSNYLPLMAKARALRYHGAPLVVIGFPGDHSRLLRLAVGGKHWGVLPCLTANLLIQSACVLLSRQRPLLLLILSSIGSFGATLMGTQPRW